MNLVNYAGDGRSRLSETGGADALCLQGRGTRRVTPCIIRCTCLRVEARGSELHYYSYLEVGIPLGQLKVEPASLRHCPPPGLSADSTGPGHVRSALRTLVVRHQKHAAQSRAFLPGSWMLWISQRQRDVAEAAGAANLRPVQFALLSASPAQVFALLHASRQLSSRQQ